MEDRSVWTEEDEQLWYEQDLYRPLAYWHIWDRVHRNTWIKIYVNLNSLIRQLETMGKCIASRISIEGYYDWLIYLPEEDRIYLYREPLKVFSGLPAEVYLIKEDVIELPRD